MSVKEVTHNTFDDFKNLATAVVIIACKTVNFLTSLMEPSVDHMSNGITNNPQSLEKTKAKEHEDDEGPVTSESSKFFSLLTFTKTWQLIFID